MRKLVSEWLGHEFVALSAEGRPDLGMAEQARDLFRRFDGELRDLGLSLEDTVRTRLWGRDRASRDEGSRERLAVLAGEARSASSSYIAPAHFDSEAHVALDLWAMRPSRPRSEKVLVEFEPAIVPLRYLVWGPVLALSGVTAVLPTLAEQLADILSHIEASLADAGASWAQTALISCFLHRSQPLDNLKRLLAAAIPIHGGRLEYGFVDGYSTEGKLVEIEVTAERSA
jgi:enamine deaminase RidA (YjgF/YER057c/UK114 family)